MFCPSRYIIRSLLTLCYLIPGSQEIPNLETIDNYMARLHTIILDSPQENEKLIATVRDIVGRLNIDG